MRVHALGEVIAFGEGVSATDDRHGWHRDHLALAEWRPQLGDVAGNASSLVHSFNRPHAS